MGKRRREVRREPGTNNTRKYAVIGAAAAVVIGAGVGAWAFTGGDEAADQADAIPTGPLTAAEVKGAATKFLDAWAAGEPAEAARQTDAPTAAQAALDAYAKSAKTGPVEIQKGKRAKAKVPFSVATTVTWEKTDKPWAYESELTVVRRAADGRPLVHWQPSVLHPDLAEGDQLVTGEAGTPPIRALDRDGDELTKEKYPSLGAVLDSLRERYGEKAGGTPGVELRVVRAEKPEKEKKADGAEAKSGDDDELPDKTLLTLAEGKEGTLRTTLSAKAQATAEKEVAERKKASVVALRPSTGEILAFANSNPEGFNVALQGSLAPGSTMKIVSASMLLEKDLAGIDKKHPCPKYSSYGGWKFQNVEKFKITGGTFRDSFGASCNTAFISQAKKLKDDDLTKQSQQVFGLGKDDWAIGVPSFDGAVPVQSDASMAASLIGQGGVRANPLNMASVVATAKTGEFHQPYLVSPEVDGRSLAKAERKLSASAQSQLKALLTHTAVAGSGAEPMAGLGADVGAKTGSAEVDNQKKPNGWFTAWRGDVAAAAVIQEGGRGGASAGPLVRAVLLGS
ncbi:penicillin-binding protein [Streptomyces albidoflavus]|uniref:penicillin-binding transpeptidase domain-containing protein n=1 Tax=Streptomyces albidoflavus TaxID=1886 RepID=UPI00101E7EC3|nr:penicillin-binding protein [Streptomyces albidoflavus]